MAWDRAPDHSPEAVRNRLFAEIENLEKHIKDSEEKLIKLKEKVFCKHEWKEKRWTDLGGERNLEVWCDKCGYVWF